MTAALSTLAARAAAIGARPVESLTYREWLLAGVLANGAGWHMGHVPRPKDATPHAIAREAIAQVDAYLELLAEEEMAQGREAIPPDAEPVLDLDVLHRVLAEDRAELAAERSPLTGTLWGQGPDS